VAETSIEWTATPDPKDPATLFAGYTFNGWWGCTKKDEACEHCYAETFSRRLEMDVWGKGKERHLQADSYWTEKPKSWSRKAVAAGVRLRVFCGSMKDVFDDEVPTEWRSRVFDTIRAHPNLNWLLLTKRPENWDKMLPWRTLADAWDNVWIGMTTGSQKRADERLGYMKDVPAVVKFLSLEPLLTPVNVRPYAGIANWFIWGGESGNGSRPCHEEWLLDGVAAGREIGAATFVKQLGTNCFRNGKQRKLKSYKANDPSEWPKDLRVREWPTAPNSITPPENPDETAKPPKPPRDKKIKRSAPSQ
jgi:protein gp37